MSAIDVGEMRSAAASITPIEAEIANTGGMPAVTTQKSAMTPGRCPATYEMLGRERFLPEGKSRGAPLRRRVHAQRYDWRRSR